MRIFHFIVLLIFTAPGWAQTLSPQAQAMLNSIVVTNTVIINCTYNPECMLVEYKKLLPTEENDFIKNVINLNIENLTANQNSFQEFITVCNNKAFTEMNLAEIECLKTINQDIIQNKGIAKMRADKLACMRGNMEPLIQNGNLFATQKMINLFGQYGLLDAQDSTRLSMQENISNDTEQSFTSCQAIYDNLKPKFR